MINIDDFINPIKLKPIYKSEWESNSMYEEDIGIPFIMDDLMGIRPSVFIEKGIGVLEVFESNKINRDVD